MAVYDVASKLHRAVLLVPTVPTSAILPTASVLAATDDRPRLRELFLRGTKLTMLGTLPVASMAFILAVPLLDAWRGEGWGFQAGPLARIAPANIFISTLETVSYNTASGAGRLPELLPWILAALAVNLLVSLALVGPLGLEGVFWDTLAGYLAQFLPGLLFSLRTFGVSWRQLFSEVLLPVYPLVALHAAGLVAAAPLASEYGVAGTLSLAPAALACGIPMATSLGLRPAERATLMNALSGGDSPHRSETSSEAQSADSR